MPVKQPRRDAASHLDVLARATVASTAGGHDMFGNPWSEREWVCQGPTIGDITDEMRYEVEPVVVYHVRTWSDSLVEKARDGDRQRLTDGY